MAMLARYAQRASGRSYAIHSTAFLRTGFPRNPIKTSALSPSLPFAISQRNMSTAEMKTRFKHELSVMRIAIKDWLKQSQDLFVSMVASPVVLRDGAWIDTRFGWETPRDIRQKHRATKDLIVGIPAIVFLVVVPGSALFVFLASKYASWTLPSTFTVARGAVHRGIPITLPTVTESSITALVKGMQVAGLGKGEEMPYLTGLPSETAASWHKLERDIVNALPHKTLQTLAPFLHKSFETVIPIPPLDDEDALRSYVREVVGKVRHDDHLLRREMDGHFGFFTPPTIEDGSVTLPSPEQVEELSSVCHARMRPSVTASFHDSIEKLKVWLSLSERYPVAAMLVASSATITPPALPGPSASHR